MRPEQLDAGVDDDLRDAGDAMAADEVGELDDGVGGGGDQRAGDRQAVRQGHGARAVDAGRRREHLHVDRLRQRREARQAVRGEPGVAAADDQDRVGERGQLVPDGRADQPHAVIDQRAVDLAQHDDRRHVLDARGDLAARADRAVDRQVRRQRGHLLEDGLRVRARVAAVGAGVEGDADGVRQAGQPAGHRLALRRRQWHRHRIPDGRRLPARRE